MWSFLDDPTAAGGAFISSLIALIGLILRVVEALKQRDQKRMRSIPPTHTIDAPPAFDANTSQKILARLDALTAEAVLRQAELSEQEVRTELKAIGEQLLAAKHQVQQLQVELSAALNDRRKKSLQLQAAQAQIATLEDVRAQLVSRVEALTADIERADRRTSAMAEELRRCKVESQSTHTSSVELALDEPLATITPLRPPKPGGS